MSEQFNVLQAIESKLFDPMNMPEERTYLKEALMCVGAVGALSLSACGGDEARKGTSTDLSGGKATATSVSADKEELRKVLTVEESTFNCLEDIDDTAEVIEVSGTRMVKPKVLSALPVKSSVRSQNTRLYSDSVANPMENIDDNKEALNEFQTTICEAPDTAAMLANEFANMSVNGVKVIEVNPWLEGHDGSASNISDKAKEWIPGFGAELDTDEKVDAALKANEAQREFAEKLLTLAERFDYQGIKVNVKTSKNYHLKAGGLVAGEIPEFELNDRQYSGRFLVFKLTAKDGRCFKALLVNTEDQRIAESASCKITPKKGIKITSRPNPNPNPNPDLDPKKPKICPPGYKDIDPDPKKLRCVHPETAVAPDGQPPHPGTATTPGYTPGGAEAVAGTQGGDPTNLNPTPNGTEVPNSLSGGQAPGGGAESVASQPQASAPSNPAYVPGTASAGTSAGTSTPATAPEAQTPSTGQTAPAGSDPGLPQ